MGVKYNQAVFHFSPFPAIVTSVAVLDFIQGSWQSEVQAKRQYLCSHMQPF